MTAAHHDLLEVEPPLERELPSVVERLARRYPHVALEDIELAVRHEVWRFDRATVPDFLAILVERGACAELDLLGG